MADHAASIPATAVVDELLKLTAKVVADFEAGVAAFEEEQGDKRLALRQLVERDREAVTRATDRLNELYEAARAIADNKGRRDVLEGILRQRVAVDPDLTFDALDASLEQEMKLARGITGAMRVPELGTLLNQAAVQVDHLEERANALEENLRAESAGADAPARDALATALADLRRDVDALEASLPASAQAWGATAWPAWFPPTTPTRVVRFGDYRNERLGDSTLPALLDVFDNPGLLIDPGRRRDEAIEAVQAMLLRVLAAVPADSLDITIFDPNGLGESMGPLLPFATQHAPFTGIFTREADIERQLDALTEHAERNLRSSDHPSTTCHVVVVFDHPVNFTARSISLLRGLTETGFKSGVFTIVVKDGKPGSHPRDARKIPALQSVKGTKTGFEVEAADTKWTIDLDSVPEAEVVERIGSASVLTPAPAVELPTVAFLDESTWWSDETVDHLVATVGSARNGGPLQVGFDRSTAMVLALGRARSGLTTLLHEVLLSWSLQYSPVELQLSLFGLGASRDFEPYAQRKLPHARVVAMDSDPELVVSALDSAAAEITRRLVFFQAAGTTREGYPGYRRETGNPLPRLVLAIDNAGELFTRDDQQADRARQVLEQIALDGPDAGVHLLLASHVDNDANALLQALPSTSMTCIVLPCAESDGRAVFEQNASDVELPTEPGHVLVATSAGSVVIGECTATDAADRTGALRQLRGFGGAERHQREPQVIDGRRVAALDRAPFELLRAQSDRPADDGRDEAVRCWIGESLTLAPPVEIRLDRREGANVLVVEHESALGRGLLISAVTTAALRSTRPLEIDVLDFTGLETGFGAAVSALEPLASVTVSRRRNASDALERVRNHVVNRLARTGEGAPPCLFVINGLDLVDDLDRSGNGAVAPDGRERAHLEQIVRDGPEVGIHTVLWGTERTVVANRLGDEALRRFAVRVVGPMDAGDSRALIDSPHAAALRPMQALLHDEHAGRLERFRPYRAVDASWVASTASSAVSVAIPPARLG